MRIAIVNWSRRRVGGVETYLNTVIPEFYSLGHEIAFWCEVDEPSDRERIQLPYGSLTWCVADLGIDLALLSLRNWQPTVIYAHKLSDPDLERRVLALAPSVFFAHDYNGTCISGNKAFKFPVTHPCNRRFGRQCLIHYFPRRCGGLSPITMIRLYSLQTKRLQNLHRYNAIVTHSDHMRSELIKHGLSPHAAYNFPYYVQLGNRNGKPLQPNGDTDSSRPQNTTSELISSDAADPNTPLKLFFSGRMEYLKGGHVFIDALRHVSAAVERPIHVTFAGDGRERAAWERRAARRKGGKLHFDFIGWVDRPRLEGLLGTCDLVVVPSLWPEPFGLVGPEAGLFNVPVAAFDVGGISDWLVNGVNGYLASGNPPTAAGLAQAIISCIGDPAVHARLRLGAVEVAQRFNIKNHLEALLQVFHTVSMKT